MLTKKENLMFLRTVCMTAALALPVSICAESLSLPEHKPSAVGSERGSKNFRRMVVQGYAVTGHNNILGRPYFSWGEPYGAFNFPTVGVYNETGEKPLPIDGNTASDAVLATAIDPGLLFVSGKGPDYVVPREWINVPLRSVPVNTDFAFVDKEVLPGEGAASPLELAQAEPSDALTLGRWMAAGGLAKITCRGDMATVDLSLNRLTPNRMYSVWATLGLPRDGSASTFFPIPLGGAPNILITDVQGDAEYRRKINFCPLDTRSTNRPLLTINVQYHANHQNYGAVPEPAFIDGYWLGLITFNHVQFPVNVELLGE